MAVSRSSKTAPRPKRAKAEVQKEFAEIQREMEAAAESADAKGDGLAKAKEAEVRQEVEGLTGEGVIERTSSLGLEVTRALAGLSEKLVQEVGRLASVREAVELERRELERLHKIDVAAAARAAQEAEAKSAQQVQLLKKDAEAEKRLAELRIKTLEETLSRQSAQIEALQKQLDEAKQQVQEIAVKAIEGASGVSPTEPARRWPKVPPGIVPCALRLLPPSR